MLVKTTSLPDLNKLLDYLVSVADEAGRVETSTTQLGHILEWQPMKAHRMLDGLKRLGRITVTKGESKFDPSVVMVLDGSELTVKNVFQTSYPNKVPRRSKIAKTLKAVEVADISPDEIEKLIGKVHEQSEEIDKLKQTMARQEARHREELADARRETSWSVADKESVKKHGQSLKDRLQDALATGGD